MPELDPTDIPDFGYLPFDQFVMAQWDPNSPLAKQHQKRALVDKWIRLGRYGRNSHMQDDIPYPEQIPDHVPRDLLSDLERFVDGQISSTLFIRTWFGEKGDVSSQDAADAAYQRLLVEVMQQGDPLASNDCLDAEFIFDSKAELFTPDEDNVTESPDIVDGIALGTPGSVPGYLVTALMHCPDQFDGARDDEWRHYSPDEANADEELRDTCQNLLILVADRKACEEGWVLHLAVNHKGQVLPFRIRDAAREVFQSVANWMDGQALDENTDDPERDEEFYIPRRGGWV